MVGKADIGLETVSSTLTRGYGTLAGLGIIGAAIFAVPSTLLLEPQPQPEAYLSTVAGLATGLACMALPWERIDARWLHLVGVLATVEAAWAVAVFGQAYTAFFFLIAVAVAYVTPDPKSLLPHLVLIGLVLFAPVAYGPEDARSTIQMALVVYPLLVLTAGIFAYLRQRMVADHRSYRLFAEETLALSTRIAGHPIPAAEHRAPAEDSEIPAWWSRLPVSARGFAATACVFALPLVGSGLAVAGVKLPGFAADTFSSVGIELPNQDPDGLAPASNDLGSKPAARPVDTDYVEKDGSPDSEAPSAPAKGAEHDDSFTGGPSTTEAPLTGSELDDPTPATSPSSPAPPGSGGGEGQVADGNLGDAGLGSGTPENMLDETVGGVGGLVGGNDKERPDEAERKAPPGG